MPDQHPLVVCVQPLYGHCPPNAHANQKQFIVWNVRNNKLHWYEKFIGAYIDEACNRLCSHVLKDLPDFTHVLMLEQDMIIPEHALEAMLSANVDVISATYFWRDKDTSLVGFKSLGPPAVWLEDFVEDEVQQVAGVGMGCCLFTTDLLRRMEKHFGDQLWFQCQQMTTLTTNRPALLDAARQVIEAQDGTDYGNREDAIERLRQAVESADAPVEKCARRTKGQDWHFSRRCEQMGVPIYLDGRVICQHVMDSAATVEQWRQAKARKAKRTTPARLSVIVVTKGRMSLYNCMQEISKQTTWQDELIVAGVDCKNKVLISGREEVKYIETAGMTHTEAHDQAIAAATGDLLVFVDDDDKLLPGALDVARTASGPTMFRMQGFGEGGTDVIWNKSGVLVAGQVAAEMFVTPRQPVGRWGPIHTGDFDFIRSTLALYPEGSLVWREEVLTHYNYWPKT